MLSVGQGHDPKLHPRNSKIANNSLEFFGIIWNCLELFGIIWNYLELFGIIWNYLLYFSILYIMFTKIKNSDPLAACVYNFSGNCWCSVIKQYPII